MTTEWFVKAVTTALEGSVSGTWQVGSMRGRIMCWDSLVFFEMRAEEEIWPVVLIAGSIVAVLMILAFSDPGTFVCVGVCE